MNKNLNQFKSISIYGIWDIETKKVIFVNLDQEETELEYDMEGYTEDGQRIVCLEALYDISSLEQLGL